ncbi:receptor-like protein EIX2 [Musa acuminata AAA Group]|uniref:receptor-like protein EIX2 n=1 Tax=Musa acuminata AAA Group TaxID=214697 RepID=UPI0031DF2715
MPRSLGLSSCSGGAALSYLRIEGNKFNGIIPYNLGQFSGMYRLDLFSNSLEGDITEVHFSQLLQLGNFGHIFTAPSNWLPLFIASFIDMSFCHIGTRFPTWIRTQTYLRSFQLSGVGLAGKVPAWFSDMSTGIQYLSSSDNHLTGNIPRSFSTLNFLSHSSLILQQLVRSIPTSNQLSTLNDPSIHVGNKDLCGTPLPVCPGDVAYRSPPPAAIEEEEDSDGEFEGV